MVYRLEQESIKLSIVYNLFRVLIQTGSMITPAILSIQHLFEEETTENPLFFN